MYATVHDYFDTAVERVYPTVEVAERMGYQRCGDYPLAILLRRRLQSGHFEHVAALTPAGRSHFGPR